VSWNSKRPVVQYPGYWGPATIVRAPCNIYIYVYYIFLGAHPYTWIWIDLGSHWGVAFGSLWGCCGITLDSFWGRCGPSAHTPPYNNIVASQKGPGCPKGTSHAPFCGPRVGPPRRIPFGAHPSHPLSYNYCTIVLYYCTALYCTVRYCTVLLHCTFVVYYCTVLLNCIIVLYYCIVLLYCSTVLYYSTVLLYCATVLY